MAKNEFTLTFRIDDKGQIKQVGRDSKKAAKDVDKLSNSAHSADRAMKGVTAQSSNATKNFSKMSQGLSGGLVPAYATLAAQIFAVTALFRFLQEAANYRVLIAGQKAFAAETGIAFNTITKSLQQATQGQLAFKDAAQAAAIGSAAGVNPDQLQRLAVVAKNASIALGRDLTDSFNRLIRGTTKAEPELLDELGIILRLDEATKNYASQIGKTKEQLTIFEKSQAVTNEVLAQGEGKFGAIGDQVPVNALNQFAKAFDDLLNKIYEFVGPVAEGLARFFSGNLKAFTAALLAFAVPIMRMILPSLEAWQDRVMISAGTHKAAFQQKKNDLEEYRQKLLQVRQSEDRGRLGALDAMNKQATRMGLKSGGRGKASMLAHFNRQTTLIDQGKMSEEARTGALKDQSRREVQILEKKYANMNEKTRSFVAKQKAHFAGLSLGFQRETTRMQKGWAATMAFFSRVGVMTAKVLNFVFKWGAVISMVWLLWESVKGYFGFEEKPDLLKDTLDNAKNLNQELSRMSKRFNEKVGSTTGNTLKDGIDSLTFMGNMAESANLPARLQEYGKASGADKRRLLPGIQATLKSLEEVNPQFKKLNERIERTQDITPHTTKQIENLARAMQSGKAAAKQLNDAMADLNKAKNSYITGKAKLPFMDILTPLMLGAAGAGESIDQQKDLLKVQQQRTRSLKIAVGEGAKLFGGRMSAINQARFPKMYDQFLLDQTNLGRSRTREGEISAEIKKFEGIRDDYTAEGSQYLGFTQRAGVLGRSKTGLQADAAGITRKDSLAKRALAQNKIDQQSLDIKKQLINIEIAKKLMEEEDVQKDPLKLAQAQEMLENERTTLKLMRAKKSASEDLLDPLTQVKDAATAAFDQGLQQAIMGVLDGTKSMKEGFLDMAKAVVSAIAQIIAKLIAMKALQAVGLPIPGFAFANGGIKPKGYSNGGIVTQPTYLAGEGQYNEAVVPLPDGRSIPVQMHGGGNTANVTVNVTADGQTNSNMTSNGGEQAAQLAKGISAAVQEELHKQQRNGGILSPYGNPAGGG